MHNLFCSIRNIQKSFSALICYAASLCFNHQNGLIQQTLQLPGNKDILMRLLNKHLFTRDCQFPRWYWIIHFVLYLSIQLVDMSLLYLDTIAFWQFRIKQKHTFHNMQRSPLLKDNYLHKLCKLNTFNNKQLFYETEMHLFFKTRKTWISFPIKEETHPRYRYFCVFVFDIATLLQFNI